MTMRLPVGHGFSLRFQGGAAIKCFGHCTQKAPELNATGLSPCCLPGNGGGAHVKENFKQAPNSSAIFRSCSAGLGAWAAFL